MNEFEHSYYDHDLSFVHHRGFGFHASACAPGVLALLEPVGERDGLVLEFGCGSGLLTRHLVDAGHRVIATDASPAMLEIAHEYLGSDHLELRQLALPNDPLPEVDAIVGIGHPISYLPDAEAIDKALQSFASSLRPQGVLVFDVLDLAYGAVDRGVGSGRVGPDWAVIIEYGHPAPDKFVREHTSFVATGDGSWRRGFERHENTLIDTSRLPETLTALGIKAELRHAFGQETLPKGLHVIAGIRNQ